MDDDRSVSLATEARIIKGFYKIAIVWLMVCCLVVVDIRYGA
jgi:hypothetical protein